MWYCTTPKSTVHNDTCYWLFPVMYVSVFLCTVYCRARSFPLSRYLYPTVRY